MSEYKATTEATLASRAIGAIIFSIFGSVWLALWNQRAFQGSLLLYVLIAVVGLGLLGVALSRFQLIKAFHEAESKLPHKQAAMRRFHWINAAQWAAILVISNVLINVGMPAWVTPVAMLIIGLHFLPLAKVFANPSHLVVGTVLSVFAIGYPFLFSGGPADPYGCFDAGLILLTNALWNVSFGWNPQSKQRLASVAEFNLPH
ncbi:hypothetical protein [Undibacterium sp. TJN19]|uniref:hypothetical protein n=1 Tax=Undibacterium sp. TJN19 TaxID=3413055 RepID=UPI003BF32AF6